VVNHRKVDGGVAAVSAKEPSFVPLNSWRNLSGCDHCSDGRLLPTGGREMARLLSLLMFLAALLAVSVPASARVTSDAHYQQSLIVEAVATVLEAEECSRAPPSLDVVCLVGEENTGSSSTAPTTWETDYPTLWDLTGSSPLPHPYLGQQGVLLLPG